MPVKLFSYIFICFVVAGCAANPSIDSLTGEQRARLNSIQLEMGSIDAPHIVIGKAEGLSCHKNDYAPNLNSATEAMQGIRIKAVLMNADAVINVTCQNNYVKWITDCFSSIVCIGDAITYKK